MQHLISVTLSRSYLVSSSAPLKMCLGKAGYWKGKVPQTTETTELKPRIKKQELVQEIEPSKMGRNCKDSHSSSFYEPREHGSLLVVKLWMGFFPALQLLPNSIWKAPLNTCHSALTGPWRIALRALQLLLKLWKLWNFLEIAGSAIMKWSL